MSATRWVAVTAAITEQKHFTGIDLTFLGSAAFRELYSRTSNPARKLSLYSLWSPERCRAEHLFRKFRVRMSQLLQEVCSLL